MSKNKVKPSVLVVEDITAEREIAELQLYRLKEIARERLLSYEEVKIYDLLTKNLLLAKGQATTVIGSAQVVVDKQLDTQELLQIADVITESHVNSVLNVTQDEPKPKNQS